MKLVTDNEEAVELPPSWMIILDAGNTNYSQEIVSGFPSYSGPLFAVFSTEDEDGKPVFLCPYHRIVKISPYIPMGAAIAN